LLDNYHSGQSRNSQFNNNAKKKLDFAIKPELLSNSLRQSDASQSNRSSKLNPLDKFSKNHLYDSRDLRESKDDTLDNVRLIKRESPSEYLKIEESNYSESE
jgi:hypothetical protein